MTKHLEVCFLDILAAMEEIEEFRNDLTFDEFAQNKMAIRAVPNKRSSSFNILNDKNKINYVVACL